MEIGKKKRKRIGQLGHRNSLIFFSMKFLLPLALVGFAVAAKPTPDTEKELSTNGTFSLKQIGK